MKLFSFFPDHQLSGNLSHAFGIVRNMMNDSYSIIPIHQRPDLSMECCKLINSEWPSSETRRLRTLSMSCENFPTCLILLHKNKVIGHCKISRLQNLDESCFLESFIIDSNYRSRGLGSMFLKETENYIEQKNIENVYLSTKGQEKFYEKNGYCVCEPIDKWDCRNAHVFIAPIQKNNTQNRTSSGPPPPPMPKYNFPMHPSITTSKTYMMKKLR